MIPDTHCRCSRWQIPRQLAMTQEDLLCDTCRGGCTLIGISPDLVLCLHISPPVLTWSFA